MSVGSIQDSCAYRAVPPCPATGDRACDDQTPLPRFSKYLERINAEDRRLNRHEDRANRPAPCPDPSGRGRILDILA